ncbi:SusC/RagA family TonB-linked outer membrane protein [Abyssalbus ytuae]|uniref:TonB-dependent receptor n=1 Tax=Abyssalbus ytuae TaxID=2926907 RepID=A0A9E7D2W2_9FLAO|nr:TonB-dependent receptor [Abyssalbus ytuae]UOB17139.1 TonB-dependent receptor [Abyssalbus ytuae]
MKKTLLCVLMLWCGINFSQEITISGNVTDSQEVPLPGASILLKGTYTGTQTDFEGNYVLPDVPSDGVLVISYVGYVSQEIPINDQTTINVVLQEDLQSLDEVVVIGYGFQKRSDITGAISSIKSEDIESQPALNAMQSIQGKVAGVNIINSDAPGSSPNVIVRGLGTAESGRQPLFVVDGILVSNIQNISPNDIESIDIMKDASSAAIYGTNASNGVILITTKKGKTGKAVIEAKTFIGTKSILNPVEMANANQYITYYNEKQEAIGAPYLLSQNQLYDTDWYDELVDFSFFNNNSLTISGGSDLVNYLFSVNNYNEDGLLENQEYNRTTIRNNNIYKLFDDRLKISQNVNLTFTNERPQPFGAFNEAYRQSPLVPVRYPNGLFGQSFVNTTTGVVTYEAQPGESVGNLNSIGNPVANVFFNNEKINTTTIQGIGEAELSITDFLKITSRFGATKYFYNKRNFNPNKERWLNADPTRTEEEFDQLKADNPESLTYINNELSFEKIEDFRYNWDTFLTFDKSFGSHNLSATLGGSKDKRNIRSRSWVKGYDVPEQEQYWNIDLASGDYTKEVEQTSYTPISVLSYFGRLQYNYDSKYFLSANFRRDGNSVFKQGGEYWGNFPSFSVGWVLSRENFLKDSGINFLKLRGGYGELGNANVPFNSSLIYTDAGSGSNNYVFGPSQELVFGASSGTPVKDITWEVTEETFVGLDFAFFDSRLSGNIDVYNRKNTNAILNIQPTLSSENSQSFYDHGAEITNKGIEASLNWNHEINKDFSYNVGVNFNYNKNNVENVKPAYDGATGGSLANGQITKRLQEGQPLFAWWMYEAVGVWQNQDEIDANASLGSAAPGHLRYADLNDDGVIDDRDKKFFGSYIPTYNYGITLGFNYKNIDFSLYGIGVGGNKVYNALKGTRIDGGENITADTFNERWTGDGSTNSHPGADRDAVASSYYLEDGDYFRINNITLGYTLKELFQNSLKIRLYLMAQNPFIFTKYSGFTPELIGSNSGVPRETAGIELTAYPNVKTFLLGANIEL